MATYGLWAEPFYVAGREDDGTPVLSPSPRKAKTFDSPQAAEEFGLTLELPAGAGISREVWNRMQVVSGRCVVFKHGRYLSATSDDIVWVEDILHARDFESSDVARDFIKRRTTGRKARRSGDAEALAGAVVEIVFA